MPEWTCDRLRVSLVRGALRGTADELANFRPLRNSKTRRLDR